MTENRLKEVYVEDMNGAYEAFMNLYLCLYEKYCLKV